MKRAHTCILSVLQGLLLYIEDKYIFETVLKSERIVYSKLQNRRKILCV